MGNFIQTYETTAEYNTAEPNLVLPNVSLTNDDMEVHYNKWVDPYNGHAYVDLGLSSGTLWATMNVGANSETDYGLYFAWGETQGYTADQVGNGEGQKAFTWKDYKYGNGTSSPGDAGMTKYNSTDGKTVLDIEDDAARANWGGRWHMPTRAQFKELFDGTNSEWTTVKGVNGYKFTSKADSSKYVFFPGAGSASNGNVEIHDGGCVFGNCLSDLDDMNSCDIGFNNMFVVLADGYRFVGHSVRGVIG